MKKLLPLTLITLLLIIGLTHQASGESTAPELIELNLLDHYGGLITGPVALGNTLYFGEGPYLAKINAGLSSGYQRYTQRMPGAFYATTAANGTIYGTVWDDNNPPSIAAVTVGGSFTAITDSLETDTTIYAMKAYGEHLFVVKSGGVGVYKGNSRVGFYADAELSGCCEVNFIEVEGDKIYYTKDGVVTILRFTGTAPVTITELGSFSSRVAAIDVVNQTAHVTRRTSFVTYDLSDPTAVTQLDSFDLPNGAASVVVDDGVAYVSTVNIFPSGEPVQLFAFGVSGTGEIVELDRYEDSRITGYGGLTLIGRYLHFIPGGQLYTGIKAFDVDDPTNLALASTGFDNKLQRPNAVIAATDGIGVNSMTYNSSSVEHLAMMRLNLPSIASSIGVRDDFTAQTIGGGVAYGAGEDNTLSFLDVEYTGTLTRLGSVTDGDGRCCWQVDGDTVYGVAWNGFTWEYQAINVRSTSLLSVSSLEFSRPYDVIVEGDTMYVLTISGVTVLDISNRLAPMVAGTIADRGTDIAIDGKGALFVFDENDLSERPDMMNVYDVRDSAEPKLVKTYSIETDAKVTIGRTYDEIHDVAHHKNTIYIAMRDAVHALNVANPCNPLPLATFALGSRGPQSLVATDGGVYVAASEEGLFKLKLVGAAGTSCITGATSGFDHRVYLPMSVR